VRCCRLYQMEHWRYVARRLATQMWACHHGDQPRRERKGNALLYIIFAAFRFCGFSRIFASLLAYNHCFKGHFSGSGSYWRRPNSDQDHCRTASTILPLFIGLHAMAATNGALTWKPSQGTNLYCLVNRGILVWTTCPRSLPDNAAAGSWTRDLPIMSSTR